jgi:hypothetical protein
MCLPVPVPTAAPDGWIDRLDHWQTLVGAATGGILGVAGAMIVARTQRSREQWIAAGMVLPDLQQLVAKAAAPEASLPQRQQRVTGSIFSAVFNNWSAEGHRIGQAVQKLKERRPALFALHTPVVGQLSDIDASLYGHLFQCEMAHRRFEDGMAALIDNPQSPPPVGQLYEDWQRSAVHARLANYFLDRFVFARWPRWWHRFRMMVRPNDLDVESARLLRTGDLSGKSPEPDAPAGGDRA